MPRTDSLQQAMTTLAKLPYFARLERSALVAAAEGAIRRIYAASQVLFADGDPCAGLYVVQDGWLKTVRISPAGREQVLCVIGPGQACNEVGVFSGLPNPATAIALEETTVWILRPEAILPLLDTVPGLAQEVARSLAQRPLHLLTMSEDLSLRTVFSLAPIFSLTLLAAFLWPGAWEWFTEAAGDWAAGPESRGSDGLAGAAPQTVNTQSRRRPPDVWRLDAALLLR